MESTEDVPPLEDMSELIKQVDALRELKKQQKTSSESHSAFQNGDSNQNQSSSNHLNGKSDSSTSTAGNNSKSVVTKKEETVQDQSKTQATVSQEKSGYGGMKKGFLFGGSSKPKQAITCAKAGEKNTDTMPKKTLEDIPFIKKNDGIKSDQFKFSEVQEAMEKTTSKLMENKEWVTDDLLSKLEKNEKLTKRLQDPTFIQAIGDFQRNPQEATQKYGNNKEVQEFFQDFCGLMGNHFSNLPAGASPGGGGLANPSPTVVASEPDSAADLKVRSSTNPNQPTAQDEDRMKQILSDPEVKFILMDPKIQDLFDHLRKDPEKGQRLLQEAGPDLKEKIQKLVSVGLLQVQTG